MTVWYKVNPNRLSYRELWRMSGRGLWPFAKAAWRKWFNIQLPRTSGFAIPQTPELVDLDSLDERPRDLLRPLISAVERHGFRFLFCHRRPRLGNLEEYVAILIGADGLSLANVGCVKIGAAVGTSLALGSRTQTRRLITDSAPRSADPPPDFDIWHLPGKSIDDLVRAHFKRLDRTGRENILPAAEADVAARMLENQALYHAFHLARGVHVPMTPAEVEWLSGPVTAELVADGGNPYRAPQADHAFASPRVGGAQASRTWVAPVAIGFLFGAVVMEILAIANYDPDIAKDEPGGYFCFLFLFSPFVFGAVCGGVGLAVWLIRRIFRRLIP